jgi:hypothetical protein
MEDFWDGAFAGLLFMIAGAVMLFLGIAVDDFRRRRNNHKGDKK